MKSLEGIDRWIGRHMERLSAQLGGGAHPKEALEIRREILMAVRDRVEPRGDGEYVFPYQEIAVHLYAPDAQQRESYSAVFLEEGGLESQIRELLAEAGCKTDVSVAADVTEDASAAVPFRLDYRKIAKSTEAAGKRPAAWLHVLKGNTGKAEYFIAKDTVYLGRLAEVASREGGLRRRNDVAFDDSENTVSREHAHIRFEDGKFRLFHDAGERVTRLFRDGRAVAVPTGGGRGVQLKSGDEIHLGDARVKFEVGG